MPMRCSVIPSHSLRDDGSVLSPDLTRSITMHDSEMLLSYLPNEFWHRFLFKSAVELLLAESRGPLFMTLPYMLFKRESTAPKYLIASFSKDR